MHQVHQIRRPQKRSLFNTEKALALDELEIMLVTDGSKELVINGGLVRELARPRYQTDKTTYITVIPIANADGTFSDKREKTTVALTNDVADAVAHSKSKRTWVPNTYFARNTPKTDVVSLPHDYYRPCSDLHGVSDTVVITSAEQLEGCMVLVGPEIITQALAPNSKIEVIRVGTCGDYPPVTVYGKTGAASGLEVEILEAAFPGRIEWVRTTWPNLHKGLEEGLYDAAYGGINQTGFRAQRFQVSEPVLPCGKCALTSKAALAKHKIKRFSDIDDMQLTVVTNPGGTNELFCRLNFKKARLSVTANNEQPFDDLVHGKADIMITDTIEAFHRANTTPELVTLFSTAPLTTGHTVALARKNCPYGTSFIKNFNAFLNAPSSKSILQTLTRSYLGEAVPRPAKL